MSRFLVILSLFCSSGLFASSVVSDELKFARYLINIDAFEDAVFTLSELETKQPTAIQSDSIQYLLGWSYYHMKSLENSAFHFGKVSADSPQHEGAWNFRIFCQMYIGHLDEAEKSVEKIYDRYAESPVLLYQYACLSILQRNFFRFDSLAILTLSTEPSLAEEWANARELRIKGENIKNRKPIKAALLSAVVPGLGKYYAGYRGKALSTFLMNSISGGVALESFLKAGLVSPQFIIAGGVFGIIYLGNIWGSFFSVQIKKDEINREVDSGLLGDIQLAMHRNFE